MKKLLALTLLGGMAVVLPVALSVFLFQWIVSLITDTIQPLTSMLTIHVGIRELVADFIVLIILLVLCFVVGLLVKTGVGSWLHGQMDHKLSRFAPGYSTIRDLVSQIMGGDGNTSLLNGQVALVKLFGEHTQTQSTGIVTAVHESGWYTVFLPTAPIPTSGMVYHLPPESVTILPHIKVEKAMKTIIACGSGSQELLP